MFKRTSTERSRFSSFLTGAKQQRNFYDRIKDIPLEVTELNMEELSARLKTWRKVKEQVYLISALPFHHR